MTSRTDVTAAAAVGVMTRHAISGHVKNDDDDDSLSLLAVCLQSAVSGQ